MTFIGPVATACVLAAWGGGGPVGARAGTEAPPIRETAPAPNPGDEKLHVSASLVTPDLSFVPGRATQLGVHLKIRDGWHVYWNGKNDTGTPVRVTLKLPEGFTAGEVLWPGPTRHVSAGDILDHVYEGEVTLLVPIEVSSMVDPTSNPTISAHVDWMVCREVCTFESADLRLTRPVSVTDALASEDLPKFAAARAELPKDWPAEQPPADIAWHENWVDIKALNADRLAFYPFEECSAFLNPIGDAEAKGGSLSLRFDPEESATERRLFGVLAVKPTGGTRVEYYRMDAKPRENRSIR